MSAVGDVSLLVWGLCGYGLLLTLVGYVFDRTAKRASARTVQLRTPGFVYHESHDAWLCPEDQWLWPTSFDPDNRVMRYRGKPSICNACPVKDTCTTSPNGKQITRELDQWPHSETGRFHRGIAIATACMGLVMVLSGLVMGDTLAEYAVLGATAVVILVAVAPLILHLVRTPSNAPEHLIHLDEQQALVDAAVDRFAATWGGEATRGVNARRWQRENTEPAGIAGQDTGRGTGRSEE